MRLAMTLLVRNEADIVEAQLAFHLNAGVDVVVATDNGSDDGTLEVLERYERAGHLHLLREDGDDMRQGEWVSRMARLAATELEADWVINSDADEFWWPCGGGLKDVLARLPAHVGVVGTLVRVFPPRDGDGPFYERMDVRFTPAAPVNDPTSPFRVNTRLVHRASPTVRVGTGNAGLSGLGASVVRAPAPIEVFHFPIRGLGHLERKFLTHHATLGTRRRGDHVRVVEAQRHGSMARLYEGLRIDDERLERGLKNGSLAVDTRLRDALWLLEVDLATRVPFAARTHAEQAQFAVEASVLHEGEAARVHRRLDELEERVG
jgi:Glycosyl transferase family 2